jgi:hypothetical protein
MTSNAKFSRELKVLSTLPVRDVWDVWDFWGFGGAMVIHFSFERLAAPLVSVSVERFVGVKSRPKEWSRIFSFGESFIDGAGSPFYCLCEDRPGIFVFDIESRVTLELLNTTPEAFVRSYSIVRAAIFGTIDIASAARALRDTDPKTYRSGNDWRALIEELKAGPEDSGAAPPKPETKPKGKARRTRG